MTFIDFSTAVYTGLVFDHGFYHRQARYITAQSAFETAGFTSKIFKENNNLFGMKLARIRKTTAIGEKYGHAVYKDIKDSVEDFALYYNANKFFKVYSSLKAYISALKAKNYFEAPELIYFGGCQKYFDLYYGKQGL